MKDIYESLIDIALAQMQKAYAPYSDFWVGAALLCDDGSVYTGSNIENASFTPTICAERAAFTKAICDGQKNFKAIAVCGGKHGVPANPPTPPCGVCRQFMREFCSDDFVILTAFSAQIYCIYTLGELLPDSFGPDNL